MTSIGIVSFDVNGATGEVAVTANTDSVLVVSFMRLMMSTTLAKAFKSASSGQTHTKFKVGHSCLLLLWTVAVDTWADLQLVQHERSRGNKPDTHTFWSSKHGKARVCRLNCPKAASKLG